MLELNKEKMGQKNLSKKFGSKKIKVRKNYSPTNILGPQNYDSQKVGPKNFFRRNKFGA